MNKSQSVIIAGFVLVAAGTILLALTSGSEGGGFFFVFPFVFLGTGGTAAVVSILLTVVLLSVSLRFCTIQPDSSEYFTSEDPRYIRSIGVCPVCGEPIPERAEFCAYCGAPVSGRNEEFYG